MKLPVDHCEIIKSFLVTFSFLKCLLQLKQHRAGGTWVGMGSGIWPAHMIGDV